MTENEIASLNLFSLEQEYSETLQDIQYTKKEILGLLTLQVTIEDNTDDFVWNIKESIKSLDKEVTESELVKNFSEKSSYLKKITQELEKRRKEFFDNFDVTLIPLDRLSTVESFLSEYQKPEYKEKVEQQIKMANINKPQKFTMNTDIRDLYLPTRVVNCLQWQAKIKTLWDLIQFYQAWWEKEMTQLRNFWEKSLKEVQSFLKENKFID